ncbi:MAG: 30S ribosomal protein S18 [Mycoplasmatales bacterium]
MARRPMKKKPAFYRGRKECYFTKNNITYIDHKDTDLLFKYINDKGKIKSRRATGNKAIPQRKLAVAIKRSRHLALMPFVNITTK